MLDVGFFQSLVGCDFLDTESHFDGDAAREASTPGRTGSWMSVRHSLCLCIYGGARLPLVWVAVRQAREALWNAAMQYLTRQSLAPLLPTAPTGSGRDAGDAQIRLESMRRNTDCVERLAVLLDSH